MCSQRRGCRQRRRRPQRPRNPSPSRTCAESDRLKTPNSGQLGSRVGKFELGARLDQASVAERPIALPPRRGCAGANHRTYLIWPARELSVSAAPATGLGVFATAPITKGAFIVEYKGRKLTTEQANKLEARGSRYLYEINSRWTIDGTSRKNLGRYVNHSCRPNAEAHNIGHKVVIRAIKNIRTGAEITYNYGRDYLSNVITRRGCKCEKCRADARAKARGKSRQAHHPDA